MSRVTTVVLTYEIMDCRRDQVIEALRDSAVASSGRFEPVEMANHESSKAASVHVAIGVYNYMEISGTLSNWIGEFERHKGYVLHVRALIHTDWTGSEYYKLWPEREHQPTE